MKKGDLKKQDILRTAETLFCKSGYEKTSIQDILDILHTSKGSFYHHFASKEILLEEICRLRTAVLYDQVSAGIRIDGSPVENLNIIFSGMIPLTGEKLDFLMMIMPVFDLPEGRQIRFSYAESISASFREMVIREIRKGNETGDLFCGNEYYAADIAFLIVNELWYQICLQILSEEKNEKKIDYNELLNMVMFYRVSLERVLSAPYGTIRLIDLDDLKYLAEQIRVHRNMQNTAE